QWNHRPWKGFSSTMAYTWSHAIDFNLGGGSNNIFFSGAPTSLYNGDYAAEKGSAVNDTRHRMVITSLWEPVVRRDGNAFVKYALGGWQLSQITTLQSAQPTQALLTVNGAAF